MARGRSRHHPEQGEVGPRDIGMAGTKGEAEAAFDRVIRGCSRKCERAASRRTGGRDERFTVRMGRRCPAGTSRR